MSGASAGAGRTAALVVLAALAGAFGAHSAPAVPPPAFSTGPLPGSGAISPAPADPLPIPPSPYPGTYAFVGVHVAPMDALRVLEDQTVVVRSGIVREVGPADSVAVPPEATVIDGEGRYLLPGLADMYVRLPGSDAREEQLRDLLFLYLANGVTTVRQGSGVRGNRTLQSNLQSERILGPTLYTTSPPSLRYAPGFDADSMETALTVVARERWDLIQPPETLSLRGWNLLMNEVPEFIVNAGGPVPDSVGLDHALSTGTSVVDRLDGLLEAAASDAYRSRIRAWYAPADTSAAARARRAEILARGDSIRNVRTPPPPLDSLAATLDLRKARAVAGKARANGVWMVPTLSGWELRQGTLTSQELLARPEMRYLPRELGGAWAREMESAGEVDSLTAARVAAARMATAKHLSDVGGGLLLGTDSPAFFNLPGFSVHRELELLRRAGITPYEALLSATRSAARFASTELGEPGNFGTVAEGNRADLVLVEENPLEELETLRDPAGVMVRGRWIPASEIEARLQEMAGRYEGEVEDRDATGTGSPDGGGV